MTKKDYILIASAFSMVRSNAEQVGKDYIDELAVYLAEKLLADNSRFNEARFLTACGVMEKCRKYGEYHSDGLYHICPDNQ